ncbi:mannose-1-phosphate guanylyltransferase/mannose-6-phosphate isomerase [Burkholderia ubonensis]|uniref:mannose-1-phosphate guanylyltransferase/mannose-6-phosphate isomerase n=1 Tax=Burkholderia ubonensis TaxID=101571 RepID=UPI00075EEC0A|nr:mannose-1-phosphate guanylyltransferase/mannose-6-phosphate isomerase [Burkholderia ubonensis]KWK64580.1 mannose-1-phosphate guanylyltransferase [Burkholderia ubonensis]
MSIYPVILAGGNGTRLWPLSRGSYPKQYLSLTGEHSLLQQTAMRAAQLPGAVSPIVIANGEQRFLVTEQLRRANIAPLAIALEPVGRNTAPAIAVAALLALEDSPDAVLLVLPSDHVISDCKSFADAVAQASRAAAEGYLVTFGIQPTEPNTGYGYIARGAAVDGLQDVFTMDRFVEKPDAETANALLADGAYLWNGGMFMMKASVCIEALRLCEPKLVADAEMALRRGNRDGKYVLLDEMHFAACPRISLDHAVMERTDRAAVVVADRIGWSDIGSWSALADLALGDADGNVLVGDVIAEGVSRCYIRAQNRMIAAVGVDDLVIVETADALLVARRDRVQDVRKIVDALNASGRAESVTHRRVVRPWGSFEGIDRGDRFQVKRIVVNPSAQLSLQMHHHRAEHWIVVKGTALVTNGTQQVILSENESTYIPVGTTHRLSNPGKIPLELIEVQSGAYLGEDDIVRLEDTYGRAPAA